MRRRIISSQCERALTLAAHKQLLMLCGLGCSNIFPVLTTSRLNSLFSFTSSSSSSSSSSPSAAGAAAVTPAGTNFLANNFTKSSTLNSECHASANHKINNNICNTERLESECTTEEHYKEKKEEQYETEGEQKQEVQVRTDGASVLSKEDLELIVNALRNQRSSKVNSEDSTNNSNCDEGADVKQSIMGGPGIGTRHGDMLAAFTCGRCDYRMVKKFSKHAYTKGIVIVECPNCHVKHLLADHLGWLEDKPWTIEDLLREKNEKFVQFGEGCFEV